MRRGRKLILVMFVTVSVGFGVERLARTPQACWFVDAYQTVQKADAPLNVWERVLYSFVVTKARTVNERQLRSSVCGEAL